LYSFRQASEWFTKAQVGSLDSPVYNNYIVYANSSIARSPATFMKKKIFFPWIPDESHLLHFPRQKPKESHLHCEMLKLIIVLLLKYSDFCGCFVHSIGCSIKWAPASRNY
jgi:hypothetical protein